MGRLLRMIRRASLGLLAVLCVTTGGLWVRSYWRPDVFGISAGPGGVVFNSYAGAMSMSWQSTPTGRYGTFWWSPSMRVRLEHSLRRLGQFGAHSQMIDHCRVLTLIFPHWAMVLLMGLAPVVRTARRAASSTTGACPACGYDLRATPDRCPECGMVPKAQPARPGGAGG